MFIAALSVIIPNWKQHKYHQQVNGNATLLCSYYGILLNIKKEQSSYICNNMDTSQNCEQRN